MAENIVELLTDVADAIREKKGSNEPINAQNFADEIRSIEGGGEQPSVEEKDVNFYDYDGTLLFSYTLAEAQALTELPTPPTHEGLVFDGWNWEYEDVIALEYPMDIGAMYITDDRKTRLYLDINHDNAKDIELALYVTNNSEVMVDWGDGSPAETYVNSYAINIPHSYANFGEYVITIECIKGNFRLSGGGNYNVVGKILAPSSERNASLKKVEIGAGCSAISSHAFQYCRLLSISISQNVAAIHNTSFLATDIRAVIIPINCTELGYGAFQFSLIQHIALPKGLTSLSVNLFQLSQLKRICIPPMVNTIPNNLCTSCNVREIYLPPSVTTIQNFAFQQCRFLRKINIPQGVTSIPNYALGDCNVLQKLIIPPSVTSIGTYTMYSLMCIAYIDFSKHTSIPTLAATNSIGNLNAETKIVVPDALYDEWIVATNWTTHANRIVKDSEYVRPL